MKTKRADLRGKRTVSMHGLEGGQTQPENARVVCVIHAEPNIAGGKLKSCPDLCFVKLAETVVEALVHYLSEFSCHKHAVDPAAGHLSGSLPG